MKIKNIKKTKRLYYFVLIAFILSIAYSIYMISEAPSEDVNTLTRQKSDYVLMLLQCVLGLVAMHLPDMLNKSFHVRIPTNTIISYLIFLYAAIILGEVRSFYYRFEHWDTVLHAFSAGMLGSLGFDVVNFLNKSGTIKMQLSPFFVALFAFCFAISIGVLWEIYEFTFDGLLGLNMQKFRLEDGTNLIGRLALEDTMDDLIIDCIGAFVTSTIGYFAIVHYKKHIESKLNDENINKE